eukprot:9494540-Pyramimonas_sp.AAC.1
MIRAKPQDPRPAPKIEGDLHHDSWQPRSQGSIAKGGEPERLVVFGAIPRETPRDSTAPFFGFSSHRLIPDTAFRRLPRTEGPMLPGMVFLKSRESGTPSFLPDPNRGGTKQRRPETPF